MLLSTGIGGGSVIELIRGYLEKREEIKELKKKPISILFEVSKMDVD